MKYQKEVGTAALVVIIALAAMSSYFTADKVTVQGVIYAKDENGFFIKAYIKGIDLGDVGENYYVYIIVRAISVQGEATEQKIVWRW